MMQENARVIKVSLPENRTASVVLNDGASVEQFLLSCCLSRDRAGDCASGQIAGEIGEDMYAQAQNAQNDQAERIVLEPQEHFVRVKKRRDMEDSNYFVPHRNDLIETYVSQMIYLYYEYLKCTLPSLAALFIDSDKLWMLRRKSFLVFKIFSDRHLHHNNNLKSFVFSHLLKQVYNY